jgi:murein DD-endopeptidase MepM/ murein hydrolase activator NlpD
MSRLFIFLLGVLVGAAGVAYFYSSYRPLPNQNASSNAPIFQTARVEPPPPPPLPSPAEMSQPLPGDTLDRSTMAEAVTPPQVTAPPAESATIEPASPNQAFAPSPSTMLVNKSLLIPVTGVKAGQLVDTYTQARGEGRSHDAIDIMASRGTPVLAADDGQVAKLFTSKPGGLTVYEFDRDSKLAYYYAHLDRYAPGLVEGAQLKRGDLVGYVGSTGNASPDAPHLHFAVFVLGPEKKWWKGTAINPFPLLGGQAAKPIMQAPR